jgi:hypothetical protein
MYRPYFVIGAILRRLQFSLKINYLRYVYVITREAVVCHSQRSRHTYLHTDPGSRSPESR